MGKSYPRKRCGRCEHFVPVISSIETDKEDEGVCVLAAEALEVFNMKGSSWRKASDNCHQYKKARNVQLKLPL